MDRKKTMERVERDNMGFDLTTQEWDDLKLIKEFIKKEYTDIVPPLLWNEVGQIILKEIEQYKGSKVYVIEVEITEKDENGIFKKKEVKLLKYIYNKKPRSMETIILEEKFRRKIKR